ncbi:YsnF/AvaK domain-containing protein [Geminocystis sp.]|uniref:YsnF/AvaK domain-containing protein n=1 Tax=Geminocystis sp. TaxID=2664100 RepID=UPI003592F1CE
MQANKSPIKEPSDGNKAKPLTQPISLTDAETVKLYEERMIVDKDRTKTGEVEIGKHIELKTAHVSMPIEKEHIVIERTPMSEQTVATDNVDAFDDNKTIRMEVYEDTPDIHKEAFVREEVTIRKEVIKETIKAEETLRREELDVDTKGNPIIDKSSNQTENLLR